MNCNFDTPLNYEGVAPAEGEPFAFSNMICVDSKTEQIVGTNSETFYIDKTLSYGQIIIIAFLLTLYIFLVLQSIWNFVKQDSNQKL